MTDPRAEQGSSSGKPDEGSGERSTVRPPFDPEEFARESDVMMRVVEARAASEQPTAPPPRGLPLYEPALSSGTMPSFGAVASDAVPRLVMTGEDLEWFDIPPSA